MVSSPTDPLSGHLGHLDISQEEALSQLKEELADVSPEFYDPSNPRHEDDSLLRFLRARKFDVKKTKTMWVDCEKWRKDFGVQELFENWKETEEEKEHVRKIYPRFHHKLDKEGNPVYYEIYGNLHGSRLWNYTTLERQLQRFVAESERSYHIRIPACEKKVGKKLESQLVIMDLKGAGLTDFWPIKDYLFKSTQYLQDYYPERLNHMYIVNSPMLFSVAWAIIKTWLDEVTASKITILGWDPTPTLLEKISEEDLPDFLGGKCKCEGSEGCVASDDGPWNEHGEETKVVTANTNQGPSQQLKDDSSAQNTGLQAELPS